MTTENVTFGRRLLHEIICLNSIHTGIRISFNLFLFFFSFHCVCVCVLGISLYLQLAPLLLLRLFLMSLCTFYLRSIGFREATFPCSRRTDDNSTWPRNAWIDAEADAKVFDSICRRPVTKICSRSLSIFRFASLSLLNFIGTCHCGRCHSVDEDAGVRIYGEHHVFQFWNSVYFCV